MQYNNAAGTVARVARGRAEEGNGREREREVEQQINGSKIWQTKWTKGAQIDVPREKFANAIATANSVCIVGGQGGVEVGEEEGQSLTVGLIERLFLLLLETCQCEKFFV